MPPDVWLSAWHRANAPARYEHAAVYPPPYAHHASFSQTGALPYVAPSPPPPAAEPPSSEIRVGDDGYIHGIDGMLDQVSQAFARHAGPMLVRDVLPRVRHDRELHKNIGSAIGQKVADEVGPWLVLGAVATIVVALVSAGRWYSETRA